MLKEEFKTRWESNENGGGITFEDIGDCAKEWGLCNRPHIMDICLVKDMVLKAADIQEDKK